MSEPSQVFEVTITYKVSEERVRDLLVSAFEGGSNYWYMIERHDYGKYTEKDFETGGEFYNPEYPGMDHYLLPFVPGCGLIISDSVDDERKDEHRLDRESILKGLTLMEQNWPRHWGNFVTENDDAETADVFLQLCLLGDIVYG